MFVCQKKHVTLVKEEDFRYFQVRVVVFLRVEDTVRAIVAIRQHQLCRVILDGDLGTDEILTLALGIVGKVRQDVSHQPSRPVVGNVLDPIGVFDGRKQRVEEVTFRSIELCEIGKRAGHSVFLSYGNRVCTGKESQAANTCVIH